VGRSRGQGRQDQSHVEANAADYFPVDMSKYHITYTLQERKTSGEDAGCRLLVMAAPIAILEGYFRLAVLMGFSVQAADYGGNSQYRLLRRSTPTASRVCGHQRRIFRHDDPEKIETSPAAHVPLRRGRLRRGLHEQHGQERG
jgi:hypothetical protein